MSTIKVFNYQYSAAGGETQVTVNLPTGDSFPNGSYSVLASLAGCDKIVGIDVPAASRTATQFVAVPTAPLKAGDKIDFKAYDRSLLRTMTIGGADFGNESPATAHLSDGLWSFTNSAQLSATVRLPAGAIIQSLKLFYNYGGGAGSIQWSLNKRDYTSGAKTTIQQSATINSGSVWTSDTMAVTYQIEQYFEVYVVIFLLFPGANIRIGWIGVDYLLNADG